MRPAREGYLCPAPNPNHRKSKSFKCGCPEFPFLNLGQRPSPTSSLSLHERRKKMELGISMFGDLPVDPATGKFLPTQQRLQEIIEEIKLMDEVGLDYFGIGEHHRPDYAVPSP